MYHWITCCSFPAFPRLSNFHSSNWNHKLGFVFDSCPCLFQNINNTPNKHACIPDQQLSGNLRFSKQRMRIWSTLSMMLKDAATAHPKGLTLGTCRHHRWTIAAYHISQHSRKVHNRFNMKQLILQKRKKNGVGCEFACGPINRPVGADHLYKTS